MKRLLIALLVALPWSVAAQAQQITMQMNCAPIGQIEQKAKEIYGEQPSSQSVDDRGLLFHLWMNDETGTWTLLFSDANAGITCVVAAGEDWLSVRESY